MRNVIIACETVKDELELAMKQTSCNYPVVWINSEFHIDPNLLRTKLQEEIDNVKDADNILLVYGCCGNAVIGLKASTADLVFPRTDDCISMVLCQPNQKFERKKATYFLTKGWIESPKSLIKEYQNAIKRYGEKKTKRIFQVMLKHYNYLMLIDTGAYNIDEYYDKASHIAQITDLNLFVEKGGIWLIKKLLTGPYDNDFCYIKKGDTVKISHFNYPYDEKFHQSTFLF